jgi:hypothetical protein
MTDDRDEVHRDFQESVNMAPSELETSRGRYSLMNWGYDPLRS